MTVYFVACRKIIAKQCRSSTSALQNREALRGAIWGTLSLGRVALPSHRPEMRPGHYLGIWLPNSLFRCRISLFRVRYIPFSEKACCAAITSRDAGGPRFRATGPTTAGANSLLFSLLAGNYRGERFVADCAHRQRGCEPSLRGLEPWRKGPISAPILAGENHDAPHKSRPDPARPARRGLSDQIDPIWQFAPFPFA